MILIRWDNLNFFFLSYDPKRWIQRIFGCASWISPIEIHFCIVATVATIKCLFGSKLSFLCATLKNFDFSPCLHSFFDIFTFIYVNVCLNTQRDVFKYSLFSFDKSIRRICSLIWFFNCNSNIQISHKIKLTSSLFRLQIPTV